MPSHIFDCIFDGHYSSFSESGIGLESGVFVATLAPGSPAARDYTLTIGDRLLAVSTLLKVIILKYFEHLNAYFWYSLWVMWGKIETPNQLVNFRILMHMVISVV